jgi:hypothetical protein
MKILVAIVCALLLFSCKEDQTTEAAKLPELKKDSLPLDFADISTALEIVPLKHLQSGFHLDSLFKTDSLLNHQTTLYYPVSETDPTFNRKLRLFIETYEKEFYPDQEAMSINVRCLICGLQGKNSTEKNIALHSGCRAIIRAQHIITMIALYLPAW